MCPAPDLEGVKESIHWYIEKYPYIRDLVQALTPFALGDPQFILGAIMPVAEDEEDSDILLHWINQGEDVTRSSILGFAVELDQLHRPEKYDFEDE